MQNHVMYISKSMHSAYSKENRLQLKIIAMHLSICFHAVSLWEDFFISHLKFFL